MKAYVLISARAGQAPAIVRQAGRIEGVLEAHITFGPYDAVAVIEADNAKKIGRIVHYELQPIPDIIGTVTCLAVD